MHELKPTVASFIWGVVKHWVNVFGYGKEKICVRCGY